MGQSTRMDQTADRGSEGVGNRKRIVVCGANGTTSADDPVADRQYCVLEPLFFFPGTAMEHASRRSSSSIAKTTCLAGSRRSLPSSCCPAKKSCVAKEIDENAGNDANVRTIPAALKQPAVHGRRKC